MRHLPIVGSNKTVLVDEDDFQHLKGVPMYYNGRYVYYINKDNDVWIQESLSNAIMGKPANGYVWDHKDTNTLNYCKSNLRLATHAQNGQNRRKMKTRWSSSKYKGVSSHGKKWKVQVSNKTEIYTALFDDEVEAAKAYDVAARRLHGEFARLNFPEPGEESAI